MAIIKTLLKGCLQALQGFLLMGPLFTQFSRPLNLVKISSMFSKFALAYLAMLVLLVIFVTFSYVGLFVFFLSLMAPFGITVLLPLLPVVCLVGLLAWWTGWVPHAVVASFGNLFLAGYLSTSTVAHFCAVFLAGKSPTQFLALGFEIFHPRLPAAEIEEIAATSPTLRERAICWLLVTAHEPVVRLAASGIANMLISLPNAEDKPFTHAFLKTLASAFNLMFQLLSVQNLYVKKCTPWQHVCYCWWHGFKVTGFGLPLVIIKNIIEGRTDSSIVNCAIVCALDLGLGYVIVAQLIPHLSDPTWITYEIQNTVIEELEERADNPTAIPGSVASLFVEGQVALGTALGNLTRSAREGIEAAPQAPPPGEVQALPPSPGRPEGARRRQGTSGKKRRGNREKAA